MFHLTENDPRLQDYLDGALPEADSATIEQHLACCAECAALCRRYQQLEVKLTRAIGHPSLSDQFHANILHRLDLQTGWASTPLSERERQQLEIQLKAQWQEQRRRFFRAQLPGFLDVIGYSAAAAAGGSLLFRAIVALLQASGSATINLTPQVVLAISVCAGGVILLTSFGFMAKPQLTRWLAHF